MGLSNFCMCEKHLGKLKSRVQKSDQDWRCSSRGRVPAFGKGEALSSNPNTTKKKKKVQNSDQKGSDSTGLCGGTLNICISKYIFQGFRHTWITLLQTSVSDTKIWQRKPILTK
jgi:hypothetical protein